MKLDSVPVKVVYELTHYQCDLCKKGNMHLKHSGNRVSLTFPPKYLHVCESCGEMKYLNGIFPMVSKKYLHDDAISC